MTAFELAAEGSWTDALSIASLGFLSGAVAVVATLGGGGGSASNHRALRSRNDDDLHQQRATIDRQNHAVLAAIMAFVCTED